MESSLWRHPGFLKLLVGASVSRLGSQVTLLALPLVAIVTLGATPFQVGLLGAAGTLPPLLFGLPAGVWVDRRPARRLMVACDLGRGALLLSVPVGAGLGYLSVGQLCAVAFLSASLQLVDGLAASAFGPRLVTPERLVEANARLELSRTGAQVAGPGFAGALVQLLTAPFAIAVDALSFFFSAFMLGLIRLEERLPPPPDGRRFWPELSAGLRLVLGDRLLRPLVGATALLFFANGVFEAVQLLYLSRWLGLPPGVVGVVFGVGNVGFVLGALTVRRLSGRLGIGTTLVVAALALGLTDLTTPALGWLPDPAAAQPVTAGALMAAGLLFGFSVIAFQVSSSSLRQSAAPDEMRARVAGTTQFLTGGLEPVAAIVGGLLGQTIGLQATLLLAAFGELAAALLLLRSPLRRVKDLPTA